jgi:hypothetical protein
MHNYLSQRCFDTVSRKAKNRRKKWPASEVSSLHAEADYRETQARKQAFFLDKAGEARRVITMERASTMGHMDVPQDTRI